MGSVRKAAYILILTWIFTLAGCGKAAMQIKVTQDGERIFETLSNYVVVPDEAVLGKWEVADYVRNIEDFVPGTQSWNGELDYYIGNEFVDNGKMIASYSWGYVVNDWTAGYIVDSEMKVVPSYTVETIEGEDYLFIQWKSGDYSIRGETPYYYVFKRTAFSESKYDTIERDYEWYISEFGEGGIMFPDNTGVSCAVMAVKWYDGDLPLSGIIEEINLNYNSGKWSLSIIDSFLLKMNVPFDRYTYRERTFEYREIELHLYMGNIVIADISNELDGFRYIIIKGITESEGEKYYVVYDPSSEYEGKDLLYPCEEVDKAANANSHYLVIKNTVRRLR